MATPSKKTSLTDVKELKRINKQLAAENKQLKTKLTNDSPSWFSRFWRKIAILVLVTLAGALLLAGNVLFWAGHTLTDSSKYEATTAPLIKDSAIQTAVAQYTTVQIYKNVDVTVFTQSVLPPRADFLAAPLAEKLQSFTQDAILKTLQNEKFQDTWNSVNVKAHDSLIKLSNSPAGQDGVINLNEVFQQLTDNLQGTKLSFLAGKQLPANVGQITVLKSNKLHTLHVIDTNINTFKYVSLALIAIFSGLSIWLARNRRRIAISLSLLYSALMLVSILGVRLIGAIGSTKVQPQYQLAVKHAATIIFHPFVVQSATLLVIFLAIFLGAWLSGPYRGAKAIRSRLRLAFEGKLHQSLFRQENSLTIGIGKHKRALLIGGTVLFIIIMLLVQLTPGLVLLYVLFILIWLAVAEILAASK